MSKGRMEAFSDGVIAIIITIMVLELRSPHAADPSALQPLIPAFLSYVLSFAILGIYWNNHHHLMQACRGVDGKVLWANTHLLFWLSLIPFATGWMGETRFASWPVAAYGMVQLLAACAYFILTLALVAHHGRESALARAVGRDRKGLLSIALWAVAVPAAFLEPRLSCGIYVLVALIWLIPDRRIERTMSDREEVR
jgi:uncharacterized membrane protein